MYDPYLIEYPEKIGVGTFPLTGRSGMLDGLDRLHANWFYTWSRDLDDGGITGWALGAAASGGGDALDRRLDLRGGTNGWASQDFAAAGGQAVVLSFEAAALAGATGGVVLQYRDADGDVLDASYVAVDDAATRYELGAVTPFGTAAARLIAYTGAGAGVSFDEVSVRIGGIEAVRNGGFEFLDVGAGAAAQGFIPMIWGRADMARLGTIADSDAPAILTFNEPDNRDQAKMSVAEALALWPELMATGKRLGSPATTTENTLGPNSWLADFMTGAATRDYRVDFVAVHYYATDTNVATFRSWLEKVHAAYGKPVWVTEWALADWRNPDRFTAEKQETFFKGATRMMDDLPFVERHAWFSTYDGLDSWDLNSGLLDPSGGLTGVGQAFHDLAATSAPAEKPVPQPGPRWIPSSIATDTLRGDAGSDVFRFDPNGSSVRDVITYFGSNDVLATTRELSDRNRDGIVTFGGDGVLQLDGFNGGDSVEIEGIDPSRGLRMLGSRDGVFFYAETAVRPRAGKGQLMVEGTVGDDVLQAAKPKAVFFFDTALGLSTGGDLVKGFSAKSLLVTTAELPRGSGGGAIEFGAGGSLALDEIGSMLHMLHADGSEVSALEHDGAVERDGVIYYVYSLIGSTAGVADLHV